MLSPAEQIKEKLNIADLVSSYIKLEKAGSNFKARCPFHNEKSPSFFVSPARNSYHCFGCNKGGDIFNFLEEIEGIPFYSALKILAERVGVSLVGVNQKEISRKEVLYDVLKEATNFFIENLNNNKEAWQYLKDRGLKEETIRDFKIGFAYDEWRSLTNHLQDKKFSFKDMEEVGLIIKHEKNQKEGGNLVSYYDRFRGRIMFPINDSQGRVVGFSGRIFSVNKNGENKEIAKYVNSPETPLFNKSGVLYGYDRAKRSIMQEDSCILVEGQMDLIMAHQAGTFNTVALSGTALTDNHLKLIKRFTENLIMSFDADEAGFQASKRGVKMAISLGMDVKILRLPEGVKDPADLILKDPNLWLQSLKKAKHIVDFYLEFLTLKNYDNRTLIKEVKNNVLPFVAEIDNKMDQAYFVKKISDFLAIDEGHIREELNKIGNKINSNSSISSSPIKDVPFLGEEVKKIKDLMEKKIIGIFLWQKSLENPVLDVLEIEKKYQSIRGLDLVSVLEKIGEAEQKNIIFQTEIYYSNSENLKEEIDELLLNLEEQILEEQILEKNNALKKIEALSETEKIDSILKEYNILLNKLNEIKNRRFIKDF